MLSALLLSLSACTWYGQGSNARKSTEITFRCGPFVSELSNAQSDIGLLLDDKLRQRIVESTDWRANDQEPRLDIQGAVLAYEVLPVVVQKGDRPSITRLRVSTRIQVTDHAGTEGAEARTFSSFADIPAQANFAEKEDSLCQVITQSLSEDIFREMLTKW